MVQEASRFFELLYSEEIEVCDAYLVNENMVEVQYRNVNEFVKTMRFIMHLWLIMQVQ